MRNHLEKTLMERQSTKLPVQRNKERTTLGMDVIILQSSINQTTAFLWMLLFCNLGEAYREMQ